MIKELTPEQEKQLIAHREEWLKIGLSCEPADFERGEAVISDFYSRLGKERPVFLHFSSPMACEIAANILFAHSEPKSKLYSEIDIEIERWLYSDLYSEIDIELRGKIESKLYSEIDSKLYRELDSKLRRELDSKIESDINSKTKSEIESGLRSEIDRNLNSKLYRELRSKLESEIDRKLHSEIDRKLYLELYIKPRSELDGKLRSEIESKIDIPAKPYFLNNRWGAGQWCEGEAFFLFCGKVGVRYDAEDYRLLQQWSEIAKSIGWWAAWDGVCIICDRPRNIMFNDAGQLHSETGKAVEYEDGWGISCWNGTRVPDHWIEQKDTLDPKEVLQTRDVEQRAAGCQIIGWAKMLDHLNHKIIDSDPDPQHGDLIEITMDGLPEPEWYLRFYCPRNGLMMEGVNKRELKEPTVFAAQAWKSTVPDHLFQYPEKRT